MPPLRKSRAQPGVPKPFPCPYCRLTNKATSYMSSGTLDNHIKQRHKHLYHRYLADQAEEYRLRRRNATTSADVGEDTQPQKRKTSPFRYSVESLTFKALDHVRTLKATKSKAYDVEEPKIDEETGEVETFLPNHIKDRTVKVEMGPRRATAATWRTEVHPMMKEGDDLKDVPDDQRQNTARPDDDDFNPFQPFLNGYDFKLARWFIKNRIPDTVINDYFNSGIGKDVRSFQSAYTLNKLVDEMDFGIWNEGLAIFQVDAKNSHQKYYTRKLISCIRTLVEQPCYRDYMTYFPYKEYQFQDDVEERVFSEIFSADWCWEEQDKLQPGHFIIPIIFGSDETPYTQLGGDKKGWPLFMSIGNIHSSIRNLLSSKAFLQLASLPAIPKKPNTKDVTPGHKAPPLSSWIRQKNNSVQQTLSVILEELSTLYAEGIKFNCSDGKIRTGHPKMCGWIADYKEFGTLFQIYANSCVVCEIPQAMQGDNVSGPPRDFALYEEKSEEYKELKKKLEAGGLRKLVREKALKDAKIMEEWFKRRRAYIGHRALDDGPGLSMKDAWKPDILHTLYEGMAKYLFEWIEDFLHKDKKEVSIQQNRDRRHEFNQLWIGVPRYNDIASPSKPFFELTQKTGKEMRYGIRLLLPVLASVLADPLNDAVELQYREILTCTRYMVDFMLLCHYRKHTPSTLETLRRYLDEFHKRKHVFRRYRAGAQTRKAKEAAQEMTGEKVTGDKLEQLYEETTNFNFVKLHLLQYFAKAIRMYGSLHNWSTETVEMNLGDQKEAYRASNRNQAMAQVLVSISREYSIDVRELNLQALARILVDEGDERNNEFLIELQSTLMLFADAKAKNAAAKANRKLNVEKPTEVDQDSTEDQDPAPHPSLFPTPAPLIRHRLSGIVKASKGSGWKTPRTVEELCATHQFTEFNFPDMLRKYLGFKFKVTANRDIDSDGEDEFHNSIGDLSTNSKTTNTTKFNKLVGLLPIELRTSLHITVDGFQTDFLEEMKVRCSLPLHLHPSGKELQEDVFFETPAAWTANNGVFGTQAIGRVICFFVMWLPEKGQWPIISEISPKRYRNPKIHRLALIRTYEFLNNGAFEEGPELAKVQYTRNDTRKYVIVGIDSIQRPAQLIRAHLQTQKLEMAMQWYVNNRIDDETWNAFFSHRN